MLRLKCVPAKEDFSSLSNPLGAFQAVLFKYQLAECCASFLARLRGDGWIGICPGVSGSVGIDGKGAGSAFELDDPREMRALDGTACEAISV